MSTHSNLYLQICVVFDGYRHMETVHYKNGLWFVCFSKCHRLALYTLKNVLATALEFETFGFQIHTTFIAGGWWFGGCHQSQLNGLRRAGGKVRSTAEGIMWVHWRGNQYTLKKVTMRIGV